MLEVELTGQRGRTTTGSGRNINEAVAGAVSETFARWLPRRQGLVYVFTVTQCVRQVPFGSVDWAS